MTFVTEANTPPIEIAKLDQQITDMASALTDSIAASGQTQPSANLPMNGKLHTNVAEATLRNQYAAVSQIQDGGLVTLGSVAGTDTITADLSPSVETPGLTAGMWIGFQPANTNTGAVTIAINDLDAVAIQKFGSTSLGAGDLVADVPALMIYDGTAFQLVNPQNIDAGLSSNVPLLDASNTFSNAAPIVLSANDALIRRSNDTSRIVLLGGSLNNTANGARVSLFGTSHATRAGALDIEAGSGGTVAVTATTITLNSVNVTDYARLSQANAFTASPTVTASSPALSLDDTSAGTDEGLWRIAVIGGELHILTRTDADGAGEDLLQVTRSGTSISVADFENGELRYGGIEVGYRGVPQNAVTSNYTAVASDAGKHILSGTSGLTFTIPANASVPFGRGTVLTFINQRTSGNYTISITSDTMYLAGTTTTGSRTLGPKGVATAVKVGDTEWIISGTGLS